MILKFPVWQVFLLVCIAVWGSGGATLSALTIGGLKIDFEAEELKQRIPALMSYATMILNTAFFLLTICAGVWLAVRLLPDEATAQVMTVLAGFAGTGWLLSDKAWIPIVLFGSQAAFWWGMKLLWDRSVARLERWEAG